MPVFLTTYAQRVDDLLGEYQQAAKGKISNSTLDPEPDSDAEDSARLDGVEAQPLRTGERIYLGLSVSMLDQKQTIPFLAPGPRTSARIRRLARDRSRDDERETDDRRVELAAGHGTEQPDGDDTGQEPTAVGFNRRTETRFQRQTDRRRDRKNRMTTSSCFWSFIRKRFPMTTQFALDQFVLRGGKLVVFVDPFCALDRSSPQTGMMPPQSSSTMDKLFKAWGMTFDTSRVVADMEHVAQLQQGPNPAVLALNETAVNKEDVVTADADNLIMAFSGVFAGTPPEGLTKTVLLKSSKRSQLVDPMMASMSGEQILNSFVSSGTEYALAVRLTGKFKTAFPEGKPKPKQPNAPPKENEKPEEGLKESKQPSAVVLVGDADMIQDPLAIREIQGLGQRLILPLNGNLAFAQSAVEQLAGDSNLIAVRSRASRERPFTVVQKMQADADANYRSKIKELEAEPGRNAAQSERPAKRQGKRSALYSFARTTAGAGQFPQDRSGRENSVERHAQETARGNRFARN